MHYKIPMLAKVFAGKFSMDNIFRLKIYYLNKSTALLVAIFPLFLSDVLSLSETQIILAGSYFFLLPLFLEIPLGILSDIYGNKRVLYAGLIIFVLAFIFLLLLPTNFAYLTYLFCITVAACCFSGAEDSLLVSLVPSDKSIFEVKSEVSAFTYKASTVLIIVGGLTYYLHPLLPIILQILLLLLAIIVLSKVENRRTISKDRHRQKFFNVITSSNKQIMNLYRLAVIFLTAICSFAIIANNRTVSIAFSNLLPVNPAVTVSIIFVVGNIISSKSNLFFYKYFKRFSTPLYPLTVIGLMVILASLAMSVKSYLVLLAGFWLLCAFKSAYRAYLGSILLDSLHDTKNIATVLSMSTVLGSIFSFGFSFIYGTVFSDFQSANLGISLFMLFSFVLAGLVIAFKKEEAWFYSPDNAQSNKQHIIKRYHQTFSYRQIYPDSSVINPYIKNNQYISTLYPAPRLLSINDNMVEWEFIKGSPLSEVDRETQASVISKMLCIFQDRLKHNVALCHGDLHPDNIMVGKDNAFFVIDWDLCQELDASFDILTFFTSPRLLLSESERLAFLKSLLLVSDLEAKELMKTFIDKKVTQLRSYDSDFIKQLTQQYVFLQEKIYSL